MDEPIWVAAQEANPWCLMTLSAFSDWLLERNDPRWGATALLADLGLVGVIKAGIENLSSYQHGYIAGIDAGISHGWRHTAIMDTRPLEVSKVWAVDDRYRLLQVWADHPHLQAKWEAETRRLADGSGDTH